MGKGTIISGGTNGLYSVQLNLNTANVSAKIARMQAAIPVCEAKITETSNNITTKQAEIAEIEYLIQFLRTDPSKNKEVEAASKNLVAKQNELYILMTTKNAFELQKKGLLLQIAVLEKYTPSDPVVSAYCADLTENLSGVVGTVEVPGERGTVLIRPGYNGNAVYNRTRDGQLFPSIGQEASQCFFNWALLPGWQKWLPKHKFGTITAIDYTANTCNITLEAAKSSVKDLNINAVDTLAGVRIEYMD